MYGCFWLIPRLQRFNPSNSIAKADRGESSDSTITIFGQESLRMMRKGASYSPGDRFGTLKSGLQCRVSLLDGSDCIVDIDKKSLGQFVFDHVLRRLEILERDYFGLFGEEQWLDLLKPVRKQLKKPPYHVQFRVRYYPHHPMALHSSSRNQFYLQMCQDIAEGRLFFQQNIAPSILSFVLQADTGDFESEEKDSEYLMEHRLMPVQSKELESEVARFHEVHKGVNPQDAVNRFLRKAAEMESYGSHFCEVRHGDILHKLGLSPFGISVYRGTRRISLYTWPNVVQVSYKSKRFTLRLRGQMGDETDVASLNLDLESGKSCKEVWRTTVDHHSFYTDAQRKTPEGDNSRPTSVSPGLMFDGFDLPSESGRRSIHLGSFGAFPPGVVPVEPSTVEGSKVKDKSSKARKARSLPRRLPSGDPILLALKNYKHKRDKTANQFSDPSASVSPDDVTSTSASEGVTSPIHAVEYHRSPLSGEKEQSQEAFGEANADRFSWPYVSERTPQNGQGVSDRGLPEPSPSSEPRQPQPGNNNGQQDELSQGDMHDSLLDLADALGGSTVSVEEHSTEDIDLPLNGTSELPKSGEGIPETPTFAEQDHSPLPPLPGAEPDVPPPKPPRTKSQTSPKVVGREKKKQNRNLVRSWVQERQLRSFQPAQQPTVENGSSQERPSPDLRSSSHRTPNATPSPLAAHKTIVAVERSRIPAEGSSQSTRSDESMSSLLRGHSSIETPPPSQQQAHPDHRTGTPRSFEPPTTKQEERFPLPESPSPPPYMSPSPENEPVQFLQHVGPRQQPKAVDAPDLSSVDEILFSQAQNTHGATFRAHSPDLLHEFMGTQPAEDTRQSPVQGSVEARHQRRFMERQLRKNQKKFNQVMRSGGSPVQEYFEMDQDDQTGSASYTSTGLPSELSSTLNPSDFSREDVEVDPRNLLDAPSPIYDRLEQLKSPSTTDPESVNLLDELLQLAPPPGLGDNLGDILQEVMASENLPPPPPHLMALSQELDLEGQVPVRYMDPKLLPPSQPSQMEPPQTTKTDRPTSPKKKFDSKFFVKSFERERHRPPSSSTCDPSRYPPEIASFMTRVKNLSIDSQASQDTSKHSLEQESSIKPSDGESPRVDESSKKFAEAQTLNNHRDIGFQRNEFWTQSMSEGNSKKPNTITKVNNLANGEVSSQHEDSSPTHRRPKLTPTRESGEDNERFFQGQRVPPNASPRGRRRELGRSWDSSDVPEQFAQRLRTTTDYSSHPSKRQRGLGQSWEAHKQQQRGTPDSPTKKWHGIHQSWGSSEAHEQQQRGTPDSPTKKQHGLRQSWGSSEVHEQQQRGTPDSPTKKQQGLRQSWGSSESHDLHPDSPTRKRLDEQQQRTPPDRSPSKRRQELVRSWGSTDVPEFLLKHREFVQSSQSGRGQSVDYPVQHPAKSVSLPRGQGSPMLHRYKRDSSRESTPSGPHTQSDLTHGPRGPGPSQYQPPRGYNYGHDWEMDVRRAQSFNMTGGAPPRKTYPYYREEDSLPNSPTFFTHNPPNREEATPSPHTEAVNRSFQEHLNSLDSHRKGRKLRVLDWMQRTSDVRSYDSRLPMKMDPQTTAPAQPYIRPEHLYESPNEALGTTVEERLQKEQQQQQQLQEQQSQLHQQWQQQQRQQQHIRQHGSGSYHSHTYSGRGKRVPYPTAKFGKDFYVIDV